MAHVTSTPKPGRTFSFGENSPNFSAIRNRVLSFAMTRTTPTITMVTDAIIAIDKDGKGASVPAITKWILANYAVLDSNRLQLLIKKAVIKSVENGTLLRTPSSKKALGIKGSFMLPPSEKGKKTSKTSKRKIKSQATNSKETVNEEGINVHHAKNFDGDAVEEKETKNSSKRKKQGTRKNS